MNYTVSLKKLVETEVTPVTSTLRDDNALFIDFGKAAYGTVTLTPATGGGTLIVHLGEALDADGRVDREPGGTIRYKRIEQAIDPSQEICRIVIPPDERNTGANAILMPDYIGEALPFRYAEIESAGDIDPAGIRQIAVHYPFDDEAASFESSDPVLNAVWDLCKYSIKATTFCGVYVDGDRERIPYEGDAYINQLGHYCTDQEYDFARYSHEYMIQKPTWCTEWHLHSVMMAWADYMYSGETASLEAFYDELCAKTLRDFAREDGLISVDPELRTPEMNERLEPHFESGIILRNIRDIMDWPSGWFTEGGTGERDNHEMLPINTVTNAFHCHALWLMSRISDAIGKADDAKRFDEQADRVGDRINELLFDNELGIYVDGEQSEHSSLHSNMFMLAFDLVPDERKATVIDFVKSRGMACSVYGAQHLLDALYLNDEATHALELMTATHDRGWWNMLEAGSTMTLEAWDITYKNNLDWNHAWGAAPANIIPRYIVGVRPLEPGFKKVIVQPQPANLASFDAKVPTPLGPVTVSWKADPATLDVSGPDGMNIWVVSPNSLKVKVYLNGEPNDK
jgi:alpha-L-rhamnosidase